MKKRFVLISLLIIFLSITLVLSEEQFATSTYNWLQRQPESGSLTADQLSFKLLAFSYNYTYYTSSGLRQLVLNNVQSSEVGEILLSRSYALIALTSSGATTDNLKKWILDQRIITKISGGMNWFLQIDPQDKTTNVLCSINNQDDDSQLASVTIQTDGKYFPIGSTTCFEVQNNNYWLKIKENCKDYPFKISCDSDFYVSLPYNTSDGVYHIPSNTVTSSDGTASIRIQTYCLKDSTGNCNYEGTLWAAYALRNADRSEYADLGPYLTSETMSDSIIRNSLLYLITDSEEYIQPLLSSQNPRGYWKSQTSYWDTAVASFAIKDYNAEGNKTKLKSYLNSSWNENWDVQSTALILYSLYPRETQSSCEKARLICSSTPFPDYVENTTLSCKSGSGETCYQLGSCKETNPSRNICNLSSAEVDPNFIVNDLLECGDEYSCWQPNDCYSKRSQGLSCEEECDVKIQFESSTYKDSCGEGYTCCKKHDCALGSGECKTSGNYSEVENATLTSSCQAGGANLKCFVPSPCALQHLTCDASCASGYKQISSSANPEKYKCNAGAICCAPIAPSPCTFSPGCKAESECTDPYSPFANFLCAQEGTVCCKLENTCEVNTAGGYSCKSLCDDNETEANLKCITGTCCKPALEKQCEASGNKCRPGTIASCLSGEKSSSLGCPAGNVCCEKLPENSCENIYGYKCKSSCGPTEDQLGLSYSCPSGVCCKSKSAIVICSTLDDCYNKKECDGQPVTDIFGRTGKCEYGKEVNCKDNFDNDGNGLVDEEDPNCPKSCLSMNFACCDECETGYEETAFDESCLPKYCCDKCKTTTSPVIPSEKKSSIWLWILLIAIVLGIAAAVYFLMKQKKGKRPGPGPMIPGFRPPVRPYSPPAEQKSVIRPFQPQQQQIQLRPTEAKPKLTKTEQEMEETIKKIRKMAEGK